MVSVVELVDTPDCGSGAAALRVQVSSLTPEFGRMAERPMAPSWKGGRGNTLVGSNPTSSSICGCRLAVDGASLQNSCAQAPRGFESQPPVPMKNVSIYSKGYWLIDSNVPRKLEDTPDARIRKSCETMSSHRDWHIFQLKNLKSF